MENAPAALPKQGTLAGHWPVPPDVPPAAESSFRVVRVAVPVGVRQFFDYRVVGGGTVEAGCRVRISFGRRNLIGLVSEVDVRTDFPVARLKTAVVIDKQPIVDGGVLGVAIWAARYYQGGLGEAMELLLPPALRAGKPAKRKGVKQWRLTDAGSSAAKTIPGNATKQLALLRLLAESPSGVPEGAINDVLQGWRPAAKALAKRGIAERFSTATSSLTPGIRGAESRSLVLGAEQALAVDWVVESLGTSVTFLLHGVTGSGKTEVYIEAARQAISRGMQALIIVPEIALTPQTIARFASSVPHPIAVLHSGLNSTQRTDNWLAASCGDARIVVGTRSAVLAPMPDLGLIVVDEEHDASLSSQDGFRYSARDIAVMRGHRCGVPVVLGSATPSLESLNNARQGRYRLVEIKNRSAGSTPPSIEIVDLRTDIPGGSGLSRRSLAAIEQALSRDEQVLVYRNRRGFSRALTCRACGWISSCNHCDVTMTVHRAGEHRLICHHCGTRQPEPAVCPGCGTSDALVPVGEGTQKLEAALSARFPGERVLRIDRDAQRSSAELAHALEGARRKEARLLVGTQLMGKGHDLPQLTTVIVVGADGGLFSEDFRSAERTAQQLVQVAGRAGRRQTQGRVLIQTFFPDHPLFRLIEDGYIAVANAELEARRDATLPPFGYQVLIRAKGTTEEGVIGFLRQMEATMAPPPGVRALGPTPAPLRRLDDHFRAYLLLESPSRKALHGFLDGWALQHAGMRSRGVAWSVDVDPISLD